MVQSLQKTTWQILSRLKHTLAICSSNHTPWYLPKGAENLLPHKNMNMDVYSSFIHNCQIVEATNMSLNRWKDESAVVYPDNEILLSSRKKWGVNYENTWRNLKCILLSKRSQSALFSLYYVLKENKTNYTTTI
jgi:hypothetical protein